VYSAPEVEVIEVAVEQGFAVSGGENPGAPTEYPW
jgi:hypothetical protein